MDKVRVECTCRFSTDLCGQWGLGDCDREGGTSDVDVLGFVFLLYGEEQLLLVILEYSKQARCIFICFRVVPVFRGR